MLHVASWDPSPFENQLLAEMFAARKRVFVDLLKWEIEVVAGEFEVDQFDDQHAVYLIACNPSGAHLGSARLLKTVRPHILDTLFPELCQDEAPHGGDVLEITRFCLDPRQRAAERSKVRNSLVAGLVDYALQNGVTTYLGVAELAWLQQILAFGWRCSPLGLPRQVGGRLLGALRIDVDGDTPALMRDTGIYLPQHLAYAGERRAAA